MMPELIITETLFDPFANSVEVWMAVDQGPKGNGLYDEGDIVAVFPAMIRQDRIWIKAGDKSPKRVGLDSEIGWTDSIGKVAECFFMARYVSGSSINGLPFTGIGRGKITNWKRHYSSSMLTAIYDRSVPIPIQINHPVCSIQIRRGPNFGKFYTAGDI